MESILQFNDINILVTKYRKVNVSNWPTYLIVGNAQYKQIKCLTFTYSGTKELHENIKNNKIECPRLRFERLLKADILEIGNLILKIQKINKKYWLEIQ